MPLQVIAGQKEVNKAKDFIKAGMLPQAIALLEKEVNTNPASPEAHFELGNAYILTGNYQAGTQRFKSAVQLSDGYAYKVGVIFKDAGYRALESRQTKEAENLFERYLEYQPKERIKLADDLFRKGEKLFKTGVLGEEDGYFILAANFNPIYRSKIFKLYKDLGDKTSDEQCALIYGKGALYKDTFEEAVGRRILNLAKKWATQPGRESQTDAYKVVARQYLGDATVETELPDVKVYQPGEYWFDMEPGEQTAYWIMFPEGRDNRYEMLQKEGSNFVLINEDGSVDANNVSEIKLRCKFRIKGISKSIIKMVVR